MTHDIDELLRADGERWAATTQPPAPRPPTAVDRPRTARRYLAPLAAAAVVLVCAGVTVVITHHHVNRAKTVPLAPTWASESTGESTPDGCGSIAPPQAALPGVTLTLSHDSPGHWRLVVANKRATTVFAQDEHPNTYVVNGSGRVVGAPYWRDTAAWPTHPISPGKQLDMQVLPSAKDCSKYPPPTDPEPSLPAGTYQFRTITWVSGVAVSSNAVTATVLPDGTIE